MNADALDVNCDDRATSSWYYARLVLLLAEKVGKVVGSVESLHLDLELVFIPRESSRVIVEAFGAILDSTNTANARSSYAQLASEEEAWKTWQNRAEEDGCHQKAYDESP